MKDAKVNTQNIDPDIIESVETSIAMVSIRKDGIAEIRFRSDEYEVGIKEQSEIEQAFLKLTNQGQSSFHVLVVPGKYNSITKEAREAGIKSKTYIGQKSMAVVVHSISQRILANAYFAAKKQNPNFPRKFFGTETRAVQWLKQLEAARSRG